MPATGGKNLKTYPQVAKKKKNQINSIACYNFFTHTSYVIDVRNKKAGQA